MKTMRTVAIGTALVLAASCQRAGYMEDHVANMSAADLTKRAPVQTQDVGNLNSPASDQRAAARLASSQRHGEFVTIAWEPGSKDSLMAWVVYPMTANAKTPVVVVVHEIFGLSTW